MHTKVIGVVTIDAGVAYNNKKAEKLAQDEIHRLRQSSPAQWAITNGIKIYQQSAYDPTNYSTKFAVYINLTDIQATEYGLRF
jgi:hypothetical protein